MSVRLSLKTAAVVGDDDDPAFGGELPRDALPLHKRRIHRLAHRRRAQGGFQTPCPRQFQGLFFCFSWGCQRPISEVRMVILWTLPNGPSLLQLEHTSLSGIAFLSGPTCDRANRVTQACRLERIVPKARPPNWPYRRFYRAPLSVPLGTSLGAP